MKNNSDYNAKRFIELSERADKTNNYYFTDFLSLSEISLLLSLGLHNVQLFGGSDSCERQIAKFGDENVIGYEAPYPISCIRINLPKYGLNSEINHRDYLGSLMALGIERNTIGDIICSDNCAYLFAVDFISDYIINELKTIGKISVFCEKTDFPINAFINKFVEREVNIASFRCDCIVSAVYNMSRTKAECYFSAEQVYINGRVCTKSDIVNVGDVISVRHKGKFKIAETTGFSKKGRVFIKVNIYL